MIELIDVNKIIHPLHGFNRNGIRLIRIVTPDPIQIHVITTSKMWSSSSVLYITVVEFTMQLKGWAQEFQPEGILVLWLGMKPIVVLFKPEYVEVCQVDMKLY